MGWFWKPSAPAEAESLAAPTLPRSAPPAKWQGRLQSLQPYAFAAASAFSAFGVRSLLDPLLGNYSPFMAFIPAVVQLGLPPLANKMSASPERTPSLGVPRR
jgi:hypothetical protein